MQTYSISLPGLYNWFFFVSILSWGLVEELSSKIMDVFLFIKDRMFFIVLLFLFLLVFSFFLLTFLFQITLSDKYFFSFHSELLIFLLYFFLTCIFVGPLSFFNRFLHFFYISRSRRFIIFCLLLTWSFSILWVFTIIRCRLLTFLRLFFIGLYLIINFIILVDGRIKIGLILLIRWH